MSTMSPSTFMYFSFTRFSLENIYVLTDSSIISITLAPYWSTYIQLHFHFVVNQFLLLGCSWTFLFWSESFMCCFSKLLCINIMRSKSVTHWLSTCIFWGKGEQWHIINKLYKKWYDWQRQEDQEFKYCLNNIAALRSYFIQSSLCMTQVDLAVLGLSYFPVPSSAEAVAVRLYHHVYTSYSKIRELWASACLLMSKLFLILKRLFSSLTSKFGSRHWQADIMLKNRNIGNFIKTKLKEPLTSADDKLTCSSQSILWTFLWINETGRIYILQIKRKKAMNRTFIIAFWIRSSILQFYWDFISFA